MTEKEPSAVCVVPYAISVTVQYYYLLSSTQISARGGNRQ